MKNLVTIKLPGDKSLIHRYIYYSSLSKGKSVLDNISLSDDIQASINCMQACGVKIIINSNQLVVYGGNLQKPKKILNCGDSGTTARLLFGVLGGAGIEAIISGSRVLRNRPMKRIVYPLKKMNMKIQNKYQLPIAIQSSDLKSIDYKLNINSAQVKSSLLFAALFSNNSIRLSGAIHSRDHTEILFKSLGMDIVKENNFIFLNKNQFVKFQRPINVQTPGDISSAAFLIIAAIISKKTKLILKNILINNSRMMYIDVLKSAGAKVEIINNKKVLGEKVGDIIVENSKLNNITVNEKISSHVIDEIPILAIASIFSKTASRFEGLKELIYKESNRLETIVSNIKSIGGFVKRKKYSLIIKPPKKMYNAIIKTNDDHRIAMAFKILSLNTNKKITIDNELCINKSFPEFNSLIRKIYR